MAVPDPESQELPLPVASESRYHRSTSRTSLEGRTKKTATFEPETKKTLRVHWEQFKRVISTAVSLSDSPIDATVESTEASSFRAAIVARRDTRDWTAFGDEDAHDVNEVDEVVVDNEWDFDKWANASTVGASESAAAARSLGAGPPRMQSGTTQHPQGSGFDQGSQAGFTHGADSSGIRELWGLTTILRWRLYPTIVRFFDLSFYNAHSEDKYRKDVWFTSKKLAVFAALFFYVVLLLNGALAAKPFTLYNEITTVAGGLVLTTPVLICVLFNVPRLPLSYQWPYQIVLMCMTWSWAWYNMFDMWSCGFFASPEHPQCGQKDFQLTSFFSTALPFVALFALGQNRFFAALGAVVYEILACVLVLRIYAPWGRNFVNTTVFHALMLYVHFSLETAERRSFTLREQLKEQCKATQKAQVSERKESDSKKRFVSYIFHEVRVPLNTALLASQNLVGSKAINKEEDIEFSALEGSLKMMSKVLNDVLDFNRMDSGRFVTVSKPYCFHTAIRSMLLPLGLSAKSRGLHLTTSLDPRIDEAANRFAYGPGEDYDKNSWREGMVLGDEMRLRQIVTNLTSNACKFTSEGGRVHVETKLILPPPSDGQVDSPALHRELLTGAPFLGDGDDDRTATRTVTRATSMDGSGTATPTPMMTMRGNPLSAQSARAGMPQKTCIVVRIEVQDTGVGIRPRDLVDNRLFSPYVQTEIGRFQGGKGTGLGLALVRNIVKLSGGRLGVKSKVGEGSTFWVELALGVGPHAVRGRPDATAPEPRSESSPDSSETAVEPRGLYDLRDSAVSPTPVRGTLSQPVPVGLSEDATIKRVDFAGQFGRPDTPMRGSPLSPPDPTPLQRPRSPRTLLDKPVDPLAVPIAPPDPAPLLAAALQQTSPMDPALATGSLPSALPQANKETLVPVLVVDDDMLTRKLMARMLTRIGCVVDVAENGQVALDILLGPGAHAKAMSRYGQPASSVNLLTPGSEMSQEPVLVEEHKYAVVFLDNQMPLYSGVQVIARLRELGRETFVVGVTGNALKEDQQEYMNAGVDRILTKPVLEKDLRSIVALAEDRWKRKPPPGEP